ncbi:MAG: hypothetical protein JW876_11075 [Candidatus Krumholzibacteriota bacterium]|nr:hypothetical protein [Candidatus Krumholzibacteriota bacterium]
MPRHRAIAVMFVIAVSMLGCQNSGTEPAGDDPGAVVDIQPFPSEQATLMALYLSGRIRPPEELAGEIHDELAGIAAVYAKNYPMLGYGGFHLPWQPSVISLHVDEPTREAIAEDAYHAWDALNDEFDLEEMDTHIIRYGWCSLRFGGFLHPVPLGERYAALPGIVTAGPNGICGDGSNVFPRTIEGGRSYLYYRGSGDCPSGCIHKEYWYVRVIDGEPSFVGYWHRHADPVEPEWWAEAELNRLRFR